MNLVRRNQCRQRLPIISDGHSIARGPVLLQVGIRPPRRPAPAGTSHTVFVDSFSTANGVAYQTLAHSHCPQHGAARLGTFKTCA